MSDPYQEPGIKKGWTSRIEVLIGYHKRRNDK